MLNNPNADINKKESYLKAKRNFFLGVVLFVAIIWFCVEEYSKGGEMVWGIMMPVILIVFVLMGLAFDKYRRKKKEYLSQ